MEDTAVMDDGVGVNADLDSAMDSFFSNSAAEPNPPEPSGAADPNIDASASGDPNAAQPPESAEGAQSDSQPADGEIPEGIDEDEIDLANLEKSGSKNVRIDMPRFRNIYQGHKMAQEIRQFAPSVEAARGHYEAANDLRSMEADLGSGNQQGMDSFLRYWSAKTPDGMSTLAQRALAMAPAEVRSQIQQSMIASEIDARYQRALESGDANELYNARQIDFALTGNWRKDEDLARAPKADPLSERERSIAAREQALQDQDRRTAEQSWNNFQQGTFRAMSSNVDKSIDEALGAKVVEAYKEKPALLNALRNEIRNGVFAQLKKDGEWQKELGLNLQQARRQMTPERQQQLIDFYMAKARPLVRSTAKPLIAQATQNLIAQSQARHDQLNKSQNRRDLSGNGRPSPTRATPAVRGANLDQQMGDFWAALDRNSAPRR